MNPVQMSLHFDGAGGVVQPRRQRREPPRAVRTAPPQPLLQPSPPQPAKSGAGVSRSPVQTASRQERAQCRTNAFGEPAVVPRLASDLALPDAPPLQPCDPILEWTGVPLSEVLGAPAARHSAPSSLLDLQLALRAQALAGLAQFDELICMGALRGVDPYPHQRDTVRRVLRSLRGRALLADEVGLGKTVEAIMVLREYQLRGLVRRALVLAPPSLIGHWREELAAKAGLEARTTLDTHWRENEGFWTDPGVVVASLAVARQERTTAALADLQWDMVVVDEAHHVKNRRTQTFRAVDALRSRFLLLLTATPIETDLTELYNLVTLIKPGQFDSPTAFRRQFVNGDDPASPHNREKLRALLREVMVRNTRAGSGLALPPRFVTTVEVEPGPVERELYEGIVATLRQHAGESGARLTASSLLLEAGSSTRAVRHTLSHIAEGSKHSPEFRHACRKLGDIAIRSEDDRKQRALLDILLAHGVTSPHVVPAGAALRSPEQRALVFTRYRATVEAIRESLSAAGISSLTYHGGMTGEDKLASLRRFRDGDAPVLVATEVGGEGQNLQFCSLLVNFDLPWNPMQIEQRIGRLHRMGQRSEVHVYNLCAKGTAEQRVLDVLDRRLHLFELVVGEMDMVLGNVADERSLEERILELYVQSRTEEEVARGFDEIAEELGRARQTYDRIRAFDEALFGEDYEV